MSKPMQHSTEVGLSADEWQSEKLAHDIKRHVRWKLGNSALSEGYNYGSFLREIWSTLPFFYKIYLIRKLLRFWPLSYHAFQGFFGLRPGSSDQ